MHPDVGTAGKRGLDGGSLGTILRLTSPRLDLCNTESQWQRSARVGICVEDIRAQASMDERYKESLFNFILHLHQQQK